MRVRSLVGLLVCGLVVSGCVWLGNDRYGVPEIDGEQSSDLSMQDAADYVDSVLSDTVTSIQPSVEWDHLLARESTCYEDPRDLPYETGTVRRGVAVMTVISAERRNEILERVEEFWEGEGIAVQRGETMGGDRTLRGVTDDGFRLHASFNDVDQLHLIMVAPCFKEVEVAPPSSGPEYNAESKPPMPDVHSDHWSE